MLPLLTWASCLLSQIMKHAACGLLFNVIYIVSFCWVSRKMSEHWIYQNAPLLEQILSMMMEYYRLVWTKDCGCKEQITIHNTVVDW